MAARKIDTAAVFERLFSVYRAQFGLFVPAALTLFAAPALLQGIALEAGSVALTFVAIAVSFVANIWFQGMIVEAVRDIRDGKRDFSIGELFRSAAPVIVPLFLAGLLAGILIAIGFVLLIIPGLILLTIFAVVAPVVVIERRSPVEALKRSRELVRGNGWRVFGVIVVAFLIQAIVGQILNAIVRSIDDGVVGLSLSTLLSSALVAPITAIAAALIYFALRQAHNEPEISAGAGPAQETVGAPTTATMPAETPGPATTPAPERPATEPPGPERPPLG